MQLNDPCAVAMRLNAKLYSDYLFLSAVYTMFQKRDTTLTAVICLSKN